MYSNLTSWEEIPPRGLLILPCFPGSPPMVLSWSTLGVRAILTYITAKAENRRKTKSTAKVRVEVLQLSGWYDEEPGGLLTMMSQRVRHD